MVKGRTVKKGELEASDLERRGLKVDGKEVKEYIKMVRIK